MQIPKRDRDWLLEHAERDIGGNWKCKKTGVRITTSITGRSIWSRPFHGGSGEVRQLVHLHCHECQPDFKLPEYGTSIYEDEIVDV